MKQQTIQKNKLLEGWKIVKLGDICEKPQYGYTCKTSKEEVGPILLRITDIGSFGKVDFNNVKFAKISKDEENKFVLSEGDILIARSGSIGKVYLHQKQKSKVIFASYLVRFKPKKEIVNPEFLFYYLYSPQFVQYVEENKTGVTQFNLNAQKMSKFELVLPPLTTQKLIVKKLNSFFEKYNKLKQEKQKAKRDYEKIFGSVISSLIPSEDKLPDGWESDKLGNIAKVTSGGTPLRSKKEYWERGTIPWLKSGELKDNEITKVEEKITKEGLKNSSAKYFDLNTVLIALYGATVGKTAILKVKSTTNQAVCGISPNKEILDYEYLFYFLLSKRKYLIKKSFGGAQPNISQTIIKSLEIPLPNVETQRRIVKKLEAIKQKYSKISEEQEKVDKWLEQLPKSVLNKAFKGELV